MDKNQAIAKIKKCLALSRSAEVHEAAAAMRQAQKLMTQFDVEEREISLTDVHEVVVKSRSVSVVRWQAWLARVCAESFGCDHFTQMKWATTLTSRGAWRRHRHWVFVGLNSAPSVAGYAYEVLARQCDLARKAHIAKQPKHCKPITKTVRGDTFAEGWVVGVCDLLDRFAQPAANHELLQLYMAERHPQMAEVAARDAARGRRVDAGHFMHGHQAGQQAQLNRGVGGMPVQPMLTER